MVKFSFLSLYFLCFIVRYNINFTYKFQKVRAAIKQKQNPPKTWAHVCPLFTWETKHFRHLYISHYAILYPLPSFKTVSPLSLGLIIALVFLYKFTTFGCIPKQCMFSLPVFEIEISGKNHIFHLIFVFKKSSLLMPITVVHWFFRLIKCSSI